MRAEPVPRDYYEVLGVDRGADEAQVKKAFRRLARELHPDVIAHDPEAEAKFKEAAEAYEVLSDADKRRTYDAYGHDGLRSGGYSPHFEEFGSISDLFSAFFGAGGFDAAFGQGRQGRAGAMQGGDVAVAAAIDLADAAHGTRVEVAYDATVLCEVCHGNGAEPGTPIVACPTCHGSGQIQRVARTRFGQLVRTAICDTCGGDGRVAETPCETCGGRGMEVGRQKVAVDVPAGISDGQRIRIAGRGHAGERGGPNGDLYVVVRVREDERFLRDAEDLITVVDVAAPLAALGTTIQVPTLDGDVPVEVPAGTQPGETILLRGRGMPPLGRGRTGDLRVVVNVAIPRRLTAEQRDLLEKLAGSLTDDNLKSDEGMFAKIKRALAG
jgi:molecular chaperone DnaJ